MEQAMMRTIPINRQAPAAVLYSLLTLALSACQIGGQGAVQPAALDEPAATTPPIGREATYRLRPGDRLTIFVFDNPDLSQIVTLGPDGRFAFPLVGTVTAEGMTLAGVGSVLTNRLRENVLEPDVTVTLSEVGLNRVYVIGEVVSPGAFDVAEPISLVQVLSLAGGFTAFARRGQIVVYNPSRPAGTARRSFDYQAFLANPGAYDIALRPGDTVIVP